VHQENQPRRDRHRQAHDVAASVQIPHRPRTATAGAGRLRLSPAQESAADGGKVLPPRQGERPHGVPVGVEQENVVVRCFAGMHALEE
jgi:hypothetical protein